MSLDLAGKVNMILSTTNLVGGADTWFGAGTFTETLDPAETKHLIVQCTTTADLALAAAAVTGIAEGDRVTFVKTSTDTNAITYTDPNTSLAFNYADRQGESMSMIYDGTNWNFEF